jgi:hypothetical protein
MGAGASYTTGNHVAFREQPDLHTAAHEAAHVVQQRAGVQLKGGVGQAGDAYEQHADRVADAVVRGESVAPILGELATAPEARHSAGGSSVQRKGKARKQRTPRDYEASWGDVASAAQDNKAAIDMDRLSRSLCVFNNPKLPPLRGAILTPRAFEHLAGLAAWCGMASMGAWIPL